jgi:hypothetical protein
VILLALALGLVGAVAGGALGEWYADTQMPNAGLDALGPLLFGLGAGAFSGIAAGVALANRLGRRDRR